MNFHENQSDFEYIETSRFHIEYAETSLISKHSIKYRDTLWQCKSCEFKDFYNYLSFDDEANIQQKDKRKYDINIKIKNNQDKTRSEILEDLHNVLKSNELIKVREE